jgi:hypothetical protein
MNPAIRNLRRLAALLAAGLLACACGRVTAENYAKLKVGMTFDETTAILGSPAGCDETAGYRSCRWENGKSKISARFAADRMVLHTAENVR